MDERTLFEEFETQEEHVDNLESALRESQGWLSSLHDEIKRLLQTKYAGKAVYGATKFYLLDDAGNLIAREPAVAEGATLPGPLVDAILDADGNPGEDVHPLSRLLEGGFSPNFGFGAGRRRALIVDGREILIDGDESWIAMGHESYGEGR